VSGQGRRSWACLLASLVLLLAGCASAYRSGEIALREGRNADAAARFSEALSAEPDRADALFGLGLAQYRMDAFGAAAASLGRTVQAAPKRADAHFYLGLSYLALDDQDAAARELGAVPELSIHPRIGAQVSRAVALLRAGVLPADTREFVRKSLEDEAQWHEEVVEARLAPHMYFGPSWFVRDPMSWSPLGWYPYGVPAP
jgi:tetratricopeptide (TPR) repeat protein